MTIKYLGYTGVKANADLDALTAAAAAGAAAGAVAAAAQATATAALAFIASPVGSVARTTQNKLRETLSVTDFGALANDLFDNSAAFAAAKAALVLMAPSPVELVFPSGIYRTSTDQNWFQQGLTIRALGKVVIKSTAASGNVLSFDAGVGANGFRCNMVGDFVLDSTNAGVQYGLYTRNAQHCNFQADVRNVTLAALKVDGCVLSNYKVECSLNTGAMATVPVNGAIIAGSAYISATTACEFELTIEGTTGVGVVLTRADDNRFYGTSEGNGSTGVTIAALCTGNVFDNFFMEANAVGGDVVCYGKDNEFRTCSMSSRAAGAPYESVKSVIFKAGSERNRVIGGQTYACTVEATADSNSFDLHDCLYAIADSGTRTRITYTRQAFNTGNIIPNFKPGNLANTDATVLDFYQEGTFTPSFGGTTTDGTISYTLQAGTYTRVGDRVHFSIGLQINVLTLSPTGNLLIRGLPLVANASSAIAGVSVGLWSNLTLPATMVNLTAYILGGLQVIRLVGNASALASIAVDGGGLGATTLHIGGTYGV